MKGMKGMKVIIAAIGWSILLGIGFLGCGTNTYLQPTETIEEAIPDGTYTTDNGTFIVADTSASFYELLRPLVKEYEPNDVLVGLVTGVDGYSFVHYFNKEATSTPKYIRDKKYVLRKGATCKWGYDTQWCLTIDDEAYYIMFTYTDTFIREAPVNCEFTAWGWYNRQGNSLFCYDCSDNTEIWQWQLY